VIFCWRSATFCGLCLYTSDLTYPHTKKSAGVKAGEFASHGMGPSRPHRCFVVSSKNSRTVRAQCGGTLHGHPSRSYSNKLLRYMYINFLYTTVHFSNNSNGSPCISIPKGFLPKRIVGYSFSTENQILHVHYKIYSAGCAINYRKFAEIKFNVHTITAKDSSMKFANTT
jgi:hypothetical protein